jgi:MFS family permease
VAARPSGYALDGVNFFVAAMQAGFGVFVTVYLVQKGWAAQAIGFALTLSTMASLVSQVPAGALIDGLRDKRRAVQAGVMGVGAAALLLALTTDLRGVYVAQALQGLASSLIGPGIAAISLATVGHAAFSERIGRNARFASLGSGLTAGAMGLAGAYFAPVAIFWFTAVLTLPTLLLASLAGHGKAGADRAGTGPVTESESEQEAPIWTQLKNLLLDRRLLVFALCVVLFFVASAAMPHGVVARATMRRPDLATLIAAGMMLLPQAIVAAISPWIGRTAERSGRRPLLLFGWGLMPVQGILFATLPGIQALVVGQVLNGLSSAVFGVMMPVVVADLTRRTGAVQSDARGAGDGDLDRRVLEHFSRRSYCRGLRREDCVPRPRFGRAAWCSPALDWLAGDPTAPCSRAERDGAAFERVICPGLRILKGQRNDPSRTSQAAIPRLSGR